MNSREELIGIVIDAANALKIDIMLIGAYSRDYWSNFFKIGSAGRTTIDMDFACQIVTWEDFNKFFDLLMLKYGLLPDMRKKHSLWLRDEISLDFVPFGGVADTDGEISWPPDFQTSLSVLGYDAANDDAEPVSIGNKLIKVIRPYWLALLKLHSYTEDTSRTKDLIDFYFLVDNYLDCIDGEERLYQKNSIDSDVLDVDNFDIRIAAAALIVRDCLRSSNVVTSNIMDKLIEFDKKNDLAIALSSANYNLSYELSHKIFETLFSEHKDHC